MKKDISHWILLMIGLLACFGVIGRFGLSIDKALTEGGEVSEVIVRLLGYLTIWTNILVAVVATTCSLFPNSKFGCFLADVRIFGGVVTAIVFVAIGYYVLLSGLYGPAGFSGLLNIVNHYIVPGAMLIYWLIFPPTQQLNWLLPFVWGVYFLIYAMYVTIRGELIDKYPYPFIDVIEIGYPEAITNGMMLIASFAVLGYALLVLIRFRIKYFS